MFKKVIAMAAAAVFCVSATASELSDLGLSAEAVESYEKCVELPEDRMDACLEFELKSFGEKDADITIDILEAAAAADAQYEAALQLRNWYELNLKLGKPAGEAASKAFGLARIFYE